MAEPNEVLIQFTLDPSLASQLDARARSNERTRAGELRAIVKAALGVGMTGTQPEA